MEFCDGEMLTEKGKKCLYIYRANLYNKNNIAKASYEERVNWVKLNYDKIIKMDKTFIKKADSKILFISFCLVMRCIHDNPNLIMKLLVFLDTTCSGLQYLVWLLHDFEVK